jgi:hypothetical protein
MAARNGSSESGPHSQAGCRRSGSARAGTSGRLALITAGFNQSSSDSESSLRTLQIIFPSPTKHTSAGRNYHYAARPPGPGPASNMRPGSRSVTLAAPGAGGPPRPWAGGIAAAGGPQASESRVTSQRRGWQHAPRGPSEPEGQSCGEPGQNSPWRRRAAAVTVAGRDSSPGRRAFRVRVSLWIMIAALARRARQSRDPGP